MIRRARRAASGAFKALLHRAGRDIIRLPPAWASDDHVFRRIADLRPGVVLDVGANEGQFVAALRAGGYAGRVISFEPQSGPFAALSARSGADPAWECHRLALGDRAGTLPMHLSAFSPSSSLLPIGRRHVELMPGTSEVGIEEVPVARLDGWAGAGDLAGVRPFLKLDVQGYELPALRGAGDLARSFVGALVELSFTALFDGQSGYFEVMAALEGAGLKLARLTSVNSHPGTGDLLWADALFVR